MLLCSDGLSGYVAEPEIASVLRGQATVQEIPKRLVKLALQKGGEDNVTVQFIQYGTRKEAQLTARNPSRFLLQMIAPFVLGAALSAGFYQLRENHFRDTEAQLRADLQKTQKEWDATKEQLQQAQTDRDSQTRQLEEISTRGKVDKNNIEGKLREVEKDRDYFKRQFEDAQKQLKSIGGDPVEIKKKLKEVQAELETKKVELKTAKDEISRMKLAGTPESKTKPEPEVPQPDGIAQ
jgi:septal ring factor EnvC (AmiA/AmiB activator)